MAIETSGLFWIADSVGDPQARYRIELCHRAEDCERCEMIHLIGYGVLPDIVDEGFIKQHVDVGMSGRLDDFEKHRTIEDAPGRGPEHAARAGPPRSVCCLEE